MILVNARHIKNVPGRKTDVEDCDWIAQLLQHGLLRAGFVPDRPQRELREALRGHLTEHHRFMLRQLMDHLAYLDGQIAA